MINIEGVDIHQMKHQVFTNINLKIEKGEFLYLIGDTGSGKSSLLKALYGEIQVTAGNISVAGIDLTQITRKEVPTLRRKLGIVFQDFQLLTDRTVAKNLEFVLKATGWENQTEISDRIIVVPFAFISCNSSIILPDFSGSRLPVGSSAKIISG